jgi:shikimate kinase
MVDANNVVLIGMPAVGKSTLGLLLAKATSRDFLDTDVYLQRRERRALPEILATDGHQGFRRIEEAAVLSLDCRDTVIATGGSVVYGERAMAHLQASGIVVYIEAPLEILEDRIEDLHGRGVVISAGQTLQGLLAQRAPPVGWRRPP